MNYLGLLVLHHGGVMYLFMCTNKLRLRCLGLLGVSPVRLRHENEKYRLSMQNSLAPWFWRSEPASAEQALSVESRLVKIGC